MLLSLESIALSTCDANRNWNSLFLYAARDTKSVSYLANVRNFQGALNCYRIIWISNKHLFRACLTIFSRVSCEVYTRFSVNVPYLFNIQEIVIAYPTHFFEFCHTKSQYLEEYLTNNKHVANSYGSAFYSVSYSFI